MPTDEISVSGRKVLIDWANTQPVWLKLLILHVIECKRELTPSEVDAAYKNLLAEATLTIDAAPVFPGWPPESEVETTADTLSFTQLANIKNVNVLAENPPVDLNTHLTVFYGENGSGK